ncbi:GtrA family protein [Actibacterium sp. MT2.3-13A]|uniref:GtrA family protein n=1 Tax=Actibacterium sp. MT2.3-13A TaxID=2828332 RepID=UPI001BAAC31C|nr:GtrA family protein [Actibacterium sp. MT2.3-13A]
MLHRFVLFSGIAAVVNLLAGQLFYGVLGLSGGWRYGFSVAVAFLCGMGVSFVLNRRFTYPPSGRAARREIVDFFLVSLGGLALTTTLAQLFYFRGGAVLRALAALLPVSPTAETLAHVLAVGLTAVYSFLAHKYISFRPVWAWPGGATAGKRGDR